MSRRVRRLEDDYWYAYWSGYRAGIGDAAAFAGTWDGQIDHPKGFEDVILYKFNLRARAPRRKMRTREPRP